MSAALSTPFVRQPPMPTRNAAFTCITCRIAFPTSERQRNHCRTDWHKYNLKRKIADLAPVNAEQFAQKVLAQQTQNREAEERQGLIYECATCRKSYNSENGYHNHMQSKKHREMEIKSEILGAALHQQPSSRRQQQQLAPLFSDQSDQSDLEDGEPMAVIFDPLRICLFCLLPSNDFDGNIGHMATTHGFFLPDLEYLHDRKGLVGYLADKVEHEHMCLYCNGRGKEWKSAQAARTHMLDKGHCKMAYDDSEDPEDLLNYYDFEPLQESVAATKTSDDTELILENGARLGHRQNVRFFRQRLRRNREEEEGQETNSAKRLEEAEAYAREQGLTRRERRHLLAITDGRKSGGGDQNASTYEGIREAAVKRDFQRDVGIKHNMATTLRLRNQVPI
ncbi:C2H2 type zinc-finger-domain-containing protein [Zychaea mexicana]|uniref:C2H2 type zinc-finger-domain-containing protein n=1 Tax=Zychaea mexicana TaxID=64656 RepID=UPI0022FEB096|nr:C2H2 type zinc-finger-domain-containing protein [Zychaea mexicana]KAI9497903.1 C2H2 type zinc-finger-domain-containing protein [Zychaea mexicana]